MADVDGSDCSDRCLPFFFPKKLGIDVFAFFETLFVLDA
jgi:hypothetical protein